jgi:allantoin racemase
VKIKVVLGSSSKELAASQLANRKRALASDTRITIVAPENCPSSTESEQDELVAASAIFSEAVKAKEEGYDAVTIDCTLEPGLNAARKASQIPVVGAGEAALCLSLLFGERFSVIMPAPTSIGPMVAKIRQMGLWERAASVRAINLHVLDLTDYDRTLDEVYDEARRAVDVDGAAVIVLGCTVMGPIAEALAQRLGVPVIDPGTAALKLAEAFAAPAWSGALLIERQNNHPRSVK